MKITIDTATNVIYCPNCFFDDIDNKVSVLKSYGMDEKASELTYINEVKKYIDAAIKNAAVNKRTYGNRTYVKKGK